MACGCGLSDLGRARRRSASKTKRRHTVSRGLYDLGKLSKGSKCKSHKIIDKAVCMKFTTRGGVRKCAKGAKVMKKVSVCQSYGAKYARGRTAKTTTAKRTRAKKPGC